MPVKVFISYSRRDRNILEQLATHLLSFERQGTIEIWYDEHIRAGENRDVEIRRQMDQAQAFLALVSPDYLASDYINQVEWVRMMERVKRDGCTIVPIILKPCNWEPIFKDYKDQALPSDDKPISKWRDRDEAYHYIASELLKKFTALLRSQSDTPPQEATPTTSQSRRAGAPEVSVPGSSAAQPAPDSSGQQQQSPLTETSFPPATGFSDAPGGSVLTSSAEPPAPDPNGQQEQVPPAETPIPPATDPPGATAVPETPPGSTPAGRASSIVITAAEPDAMQATSDRAISASSEDMLDFWIWINALYQFIISPETTTPLTIGIDGFWGTGKTSFMSLLKDRLNPELSFWHHWRFITLPRLKWLFWFFVTYPVWLYGILHARFNPSDAGEISSGLSYDPEIDAIDLSRLTDRQRFWARIGARHCARRPPTYPTIWFNAWKFDQEEQIVAALALAVLKQIKQQYPFLSRLSFWLRLAFKRASGLQALLTLLKFLLPLILAWIAWQFTLFIQLATKVYPSSLKTLQMLQPWSQGVLVLGALLAGFQQVSSFVSNPFQISLKPLFRKPDYEEKVGFLTSFEEDFADIVSVITRPRLGWKQGKLIIFIDDLDRCKPPKSVDIIEAITLFLGSEHCLFVMGVDTSMVAASVKAKYKDLFAEVDKENARAVSHGRFFLEKIIQVPLRVPPTTKIGVTRLIARIVEPGLRPLSLPLSPSNPENPSQPPPPPKPRTLFSPPDPIASYSRQEVRDAIHLGGQLLGNNPRQVKRFINLFRISIHVAGASGLFRVENNIGLTMNRLAIWVAWSIRWNELVHYLAEKMSLNIEEADLLKHCIDIAEALTKNWCWNQPDFPATLLTRVHACRNQEKHARSHWCFLPWEHWLREPDFLQSMKELEMFWQQSSPGSANWLKTLLLMTYESSENASNTSPLADQVPQT